MSFIIVDDANKQFDYFMHVTLDREIHLNSNISKINKKNSTQLKPIPDADADGYVKYYEDLGYSMNQGLYDKLISDFNYNLAEGEKHLVPWII